MHVVEDQSVKRSQAADRRSEQNSDEWACMNQLLARAASALASTIVPPGSHSISLGDSLSLPTSDLVCAQNMRQVAPAIRD